jgi:mono/diheme cytochrome c family protein
MEFTRRAVIFLTGLGLMALSYNPVFAKGDASAGKKVFEKRCQGCHGEKGDGKGLAAVFLYPKPADLTAGKFKLRSTPSGEMPTDDDLFKTITNGIPGSAMPSFAYISDDERWDVLQHIKTVAVYFDEEEGKEYKLFEIRGTPHPLTVSAEPAMTPESLTKAKAVYEQEKLGCVKCHGRLGKGDGPSAQEQTDDWGRPIKVRDFTTGIFKGGNTNKDIYLRFATGMAGTPMPAFSGEQISDADRWLLVQYVQSLKNPDTRIATGPADSTIVATQTTENIPGDDTDAALWQSTKEYEIPLNRLWQTEIIPMHVRVKALCNSKEIAIHMEWDDTTQNMDYFREQGFRDAAAVQFSPNGEFPFIGMGNGKGMTGVEIPVNIWQWKGDWQLDSGYYTDIKHVYPSMHVDTYYFPKEVQDKTYLSGRAAGNLFSSEHRPSVIEDLNAVGFGSLESQPVSSQGVQGTGCWSDNKWRIVFKRSLESQEARDVKFSKGATVPISFAVWDGEKQDRDGIKFVSTWYKLKL